MAHVLRPLMQLPRRRHRPSSFYHLICRTSSSTHVSGNLPFFAFFSISCRAVHFRPRAVKLRDVPLPYDGGDSDDVSYSAKGEVCKSRNDRKREARRAVRWGMELASFSPPQIKRILRVAALEQEVYDALMLVKRLGRDVREGKRRQFNFIGRLLREVEPELMDCLIQATKDGDQSKFQDFLGPESLEIDGEEEQDEEIEEGDDEESTNISLANKWYDGLINKDISVSNEIYSLREIEFDRQELRQLVRKVHAALEPQATTEEDVEPDAASVKARKSLARFIRRLANQLPSN
ncbi:hypothetical protein F511_18167 [Dorcoceras hygrometricum]|uniref:Uncharacterized protein n=1 Tax=Dorcoceras hygrometricum TaxID=472368 RepID=A0A2Z7BMI3_9LAMI|nr:hypothetical protein F511_18167 [Dorcoceras hygrometricum]